MSWFIGSDGRIQCLDNGPILPWFIGPNDVDTVDENERSAVLRPVPGPQADADDPDDARS